MPTADRNLLFGILALQHNFISRDALLAAFSTWIADKSRDLGSLLHLRNELTAKQLKLLTELVEECIQQLGSAEVCLEQLSSISAVRDDLASLRDSDLQASLRHVSRRAAQVAPGEATTLPPPSVGAASAVGSRFRILRPHAEGGLGVVSVAHDEELNREVALKEIKGNYADDPESRARFTLEAEITGGLEHPGIVPVYGLGKYADGRPFYAMRFIRGDSLNTTIQDFHTSELTETERNLRLRRLLQRFIDVCEALHYAHARGVLHRDLKPANIMLGKYGETLVVDWGLARVGSHKVDGSTKARGDETSLRPKSGSAATMIGEAVGTPAYMSPEQAAGKLDLLGPATDIYALGATLYTILSGRPPIEGKTTGELLQNAQQGRIVPLQRHTQRVPKALEAICLQALQTDPAARYVSAKRLAEDVEQWLADEPVAVYSEPPAARARRWIRKRPGLVAGFVASVLVGVCALTVGYVVLGYKNAELTSAIHARDAANSQLEVKNKDLELARQETDTKRREAETRSAETEAVLGFVTKRIFTAARPRGSGGGLGRNVTLREAVEAALPHVKEDFQGQPLIESRIRDTLGDSFLQLGKYQIAVEQCEIAYRLSLQERGAEDLETLQINNGRANCYSALGRREEALPIYEHSFQVCRSRLGLIHKITIGCMAELAGCYRAMGRHQESIALHEATRKTLEAELGADDQSTLNCVADLATCLCEVGRYTEAIRLSEEILPRLKAGAGDTHTTTLSLLCNLAAQYASARRYPDALRLYQEVSPLLVEKLGEDHPITLTNAGNLAAVYSSLNRRGEAAQLYEKTLTRQKVQLGEDHPSTLETLREFASTLAGLGRVSEGIALFENNLARQVQSLGPDHPRTIECRINFANFYSEVGLANEAWKLREETLPLARGRLGLDPGDTMAALTGLASSYSELGRYQEARRVQEEALAHGLERLGPDDSQTLSTMNNLAVTYGAFQLEREASQLYEKVLEQRRSVFSPDHSDTLLTMENLAASYARQGRFPESLQLREEVVALNKSRLGDQHPDTLQSLGKLGDAYLAAKQPASALAVYEGLHTIFQEQFGKWSDQKLWAIAKLTAAHQEAGNSAEATRLLGDYVATNRDRLGAESVEFVTVLMKLTAHLVEDDQYFAAEPVIRERLKIVLKIRPDIWPTYTVHASLGQALIRQKKFEEAEKVLLAGWEGLRSREDLIPPHGKEALLIAQQSLIDLYAAWEKPTELEKWKSELGKSLQGLIDLETIAGNTGEVEKWQKELEKLRAPPEKNSRDDRTAHSSAPNRRADRGLG